MISANSSEELQLLHAALDAALEPWALLKAVRDPDGRIVDFRYHDINRAAARQQRLRREDLLERSLVETLPEVARIGLIGQYAHCVETGEPLFLNDFPYHGRTIDSPEPQTHRYEVRGVRVETDYLSLNWRDTNERYMAHQGEVHAREMLRAGTDSMLDPQVLLEAVRDPSGTIVDFAYRVVNKATYEYLGLAHEDLLGRGIVETMPGVEATLLPGYIRCLETGEPLVLNDFSYDNEILLDIRLYDIRATPAGADLLGLSWRDVTDRFHTAQRITASEEQYRLLAENSTDIVCHIRDGMPVWVSPSIEPVLGAPPEYWLGREVFAYAPPEDVAEQVAVMAAVEAGSAIRHRVRAVGTDGVAHWFDLHARPFYDAGGSEDGVVATLRAIDAEVAAEKAVQEARHLRARAGALYRRSMDSAAVGMCLADLEGHFVEVNAALGRFFGYDAQTLRLMTWQELTDPDYLEADLANRAEMLAGRSESYRIVKQFIHADGHPIWGDLTVSCLRGDDGHVETFIGQIADITDEFEAQQAVARYKQMLEQSNIGINVVSPDGAVLWINQAMCDMFGLDVAAAMQKTWQEMTPEENLENNLRIVEDLIAERADVVRTTQYYIHADGHEVWVDVSVSCLRDLHGRPEYIVTQMLDITAEVQARSGLVASEERNRVLAEGLQDELGSAAKYVQAVLPGDLAGRVSVSSRYLPSQTLGGDCFDFHWIDDDHLIVYLLDVSGHGVESTLIAVSIHNILRSASVVGDVLLEPAHVLGMLNRQFEMEQHDNNYFTIFYGVYQLSTATLRYASAGHPPALLITGAQLAELSNQSPPVGSFNDTAFSNTTVQVPPGSQLLISSDGTFGFPLRDGGWSTQKEFVNLCTSLAGLPDWSLDDLIDKLRGASATADFIDDCSLLRLTFGEKTDRLLDAEEA